MKIEMFQTLNRPFQEHFLEKELSAATIHLTMNAYQTMVSRLHQFVQEFVPANDLNLALIEGLSRSIGRHLKQSIRPGTVERPLLLLITDEGVAQWVEDLGRSFQGQDEHMRSAIVVCALAGFCYETRTLWSIDNELRASNLQVLSIDVVAEMESYGFWRAVNRRGMDGFDMFGTREAIEGFITEQTKRIDQSLIALGSSTLEMQEHYAQSRDEAAKLNAHTKTVVAETAAAVEKMKQETLGNQDRLGVLAKAIDATEGQVDAFASSVREELKIDTTKNLWKNRAFWSATSFWVSAVVVAFAILAPPLWALTHIEAVLALLKRIGDAATQGLPTDATAAQLTAATISRLVVISAPLGLYFWAIKLLVRFNTRSMVLMDDARQRHTTMDTYFHMIERNGATTEERGLMLNALFRPLPGQGQENVEPPNFMELVKRPE